MALKFNCIPHPMIFVLIQPTLLRTEEYKYRICLQFSNTTLEVKINLQIYDFHHLYHLIHHITELSFSVTAKFFIWAMKCFSITPKDYIWFFARSLSIIFILHYDQLHDIEIWINFILPCLSVPLASSKYLLQYAHSQLQDSLHEALNEVIS